MNGIVNDKLFNNMMWSTQMEICESILCLLIHVHKGVSVIVCLETLETVCISVRLKSREVVIESTHYNTHSNRFVLKLKRRKQSIFINDVLQCSSSSLCSVLLRVCN